ncbi:hypothetical protein M0813_24276 [Anaeramoeba flamelloides]|uniref:Transmembrane protein n=1 Tax=Anaeramoeba flamelloides TaxID=1746091 RepID=A0AAV7YRC1_9EUKA|nr:hypothetical protein M0812_21265 [Anaeramoeba flamelloides]KAJ6240279.1 hypothetical protein M0813_24276 [Anaeramoeba flamelloides]
MANSDFDQYFDESIVNEDIFGEFNSSIGTEEPFILSSMSRRSIHRQTTGQGIWTFLTSRELRKRKKTFGAILSLLLCSIVLLISAFWFLSNSKAFASFLGFMLSGLLGFSGWYNLRLLYRAVLGESSYFNQIPTYDEL